MKTLMIPKRFGYPTVEITINGKEQTFASGEEISVEDSVAEAIENAIALAPKLGVPRNKLIQVVDRSVTEVTMADLEGVTQIGSCAFRNCVNLVSVDIPNSVTTIGTQAFYSCTKLVRIEVPNFVTKILSGAFYNCKALTSIVMPSSLKEIGDDVFNYCENLKEVTMLATEPPSIEVNTFQSVPSTCIYRVPTESLEAYKVAKYWSVIANQIVAIEK